METMIDELAHLAGKDPVAVGVGLPRDHTASPNVHPPGQPHHA
jgi:hypothetical protein